MLKKKKNSNITFEMMIITIIIKFDLQTNIMQEQRPARSEMIKFAMRSINGEC